MKTATSIMRGLVAATAIALSAAAYSLTQGGGGDNNTRPTAAPAEACYGHGCCGRQWANARHHGCRPAPPRHHRRAGCGYAHDFCRGYHCDGSHACYYGCAIEGADTGTFGTLGGGYAKDSRRAYYAGQPIEGADAKTFKYIGRGVAKDKRHTYIDGQRAD